MSRRTSKSRFVIDCLYLYEESKADYCKGRYFCLLCRFLMSLIEHGEISSDKQKESGIFY